MCLSSRCIKMISQRHRNTESSFDSSGVDLAIQVSDPVCQDEEHTDPLVGCYSSSPPFLRAELFCFENLKT